MFAWVDLFWMAGGGAIVWFFKDTILKWWQGAEQFAANLKAKAATIEAQLVAAKTAITTTK